MENTKTFSRAWRTNPFLVAVLVAECQAFGWSARAMETEPSRSSRFSCSAYTCDGWKVLGRVPRPRVHLKPHSALTKPLLTVQTGGACFWLVLGAVLGAAINIYCSAWTTRNLPLTTLSCSVSFTDHGVLRGPVCDIDSWLWSVLPRLDHPGSDLRCAMEVTHRMISL